jgi:hypothetical protein
MVSVSYLLNYRLNLSDKEFKVASSFLLGGEERLQKAVIFGLEVLELNIVYSDI